MLSLRHDLKEKLIKLLSILFVLQALTGLPVQTISTANAAVDGRGCETNYPTTGWKPIRSASGAIPTDMFGNSSADFTPYRNTADIVGTTDRNPVEWFTTGSSCDFFFRMRVVAKPTDSNGKLDNMIWQVAIGNSTSGTIAWTGVNGGGSGSDTKVYIYKPSTTTTRYVDTVAKTVNLDTTTNRNVSIISAGVASDYWVQWRVPYSEFTAAGANITSAPMGLWAGTSQSNSLSSINADCLDSFRKGGVVTGDCTTPDFTLVSASNLSAPLSTVVADPAQSIIQSNATLNANGTDTATVTVTLKSSAGVALTSSGGTVTLSLTSPSPSGVTGTLSAVTDNGNGTYTARFTAGRVAGTVNVVAKLDGVSITGTPSAAIMTLNVSNDPYATTNAATNVTASQANLNAAFANPSNASVDTFIEYCLSAAGTCTSSAITASITTITVGALSATTNSDTSTVISGLSAGSTYYFRAYVKNAANTRFDGEIKSFVAGAPVATTSEATSVTGTTATLNGTVNASGGTATITFCLSLSSTVDGNGALSTCITTGTPTNSPATGTSNTSSTAAATGLTPGNTYFFQIIGTSGGLTSYGSVLNFTTGDHTATTNDATSISQTGATLNGTIGTAGGQSITVTFVWSSTSDFSSDTTTVSVSPVTTDPSGTTSTPLTGLTAGTTYYFYVTGTLAGVTKTGATLSFTTTTNSPAPAPVYVPHPPTITNISAPEVCAIGSQLTLTGTYLSGATATVDGVAAQVLSSSYGSMLISLPARSVGTKTIVVTNVDGTASTTVKYKFVDSPIYVNYIYPETFKDRDFSYVFKATNAEKYSIIGTMPAGLSLNPLTGEISGAPTVEGDFLFTIVASNYCDETYLNVYMFVDKAIPNTYTCSVAFNVPKSDNITDIKLGQLKTCLDRIKVISPKYIDPIIFLSGGLPAGLTTEQALTHPRYIKIIDFIKSIGLDYQIYVGAFGGTAESVQINVYWPST